MSLNQTPSGIEQLGDGHPGWTGSDLATGNLAAMEGIILKASS